MLTGRKWQLLLLPACYALLHVRRTVLTSCVCLLAAASLLSFVPFNMFAYPYVTNNLAMNVACVAIFLLCGVFTQGEHVVDVWLFHRAAFARPSHTIRFRDAKSSVVE